MGRTAIGTFDPASGLPLPVIPDATVQQSSVHIWPYLTVEQYRFGGGLDTPEFVTVEHAVAVHLSAPSLIEVTISGKQRLNVHEPGHMSLFPSGVPRQVRTNEPHEVFVVFISPKIVTDALEESSKNIELVENCCYRDPQCEHLTRALKAEADSNYVSGPLYGDSLALALGSHLVAKHSLLQASAPIAFKGGIAPLTLRRVLEYIQDNVDKELRLASLALVTGLSPFRFAHNFKRATGVAPHQYVTRVRLERGKHLLRKTDMSILEIAQTVGFQHSNRFTTLFSRATGMTPSAYRALSR